MYPDLGSWLRAANTDTIVAVTDSSLEFHPDSKLTGQQSHWRERFFVNATSLTILSDPAGPKQR